MYKAYADFTYHHGLTLSQVLDIFVLTGMDILPSVGKVGDVFDGVCTQLEVGFIEIPPQI